MSRRLAVLGATGSVGRSTLEVVRHHPQRLSIVALAAQGSNLELLESQVREFSVRRVAVGDREKARALAARVSGSVEVLAGEDGLLEVATQPDVDCVVAAIVGAAGLPPVAAALAAGKDVALANKESLVVAGRLLTGLAERTGGQIVPVDSEHVALHQALRCGESAEVRRLMLTASGGPFLHRDLSTWDRILPEEALQHPTWKMGDKISIDSATLMNKGLELIEASHLFSVAVDRLDVLIHPQSVVHSVVEFHDGSCVAQLSANDMVVPIQYALSYPERWQSEFRRLPIAELHRLEFFPLDEEKFPTVNLARQALTAGDSAPAVLNAANEQAVQAFLARRIPFPGIVSCIERVLEEHEAVSFASFEDAVAWDAWGRRKAQEALAADSGSV